MGETTAACGFGGMERAETFTKPVNFQLYANQMHHPVLEHEQDNANAAGGIKVPREVVQQLTTLREESKEEAERSVRASLPTGAEYSHTKRQLHQMLPMQQPPHGLNVGGLFSECSPRLAAPATTAP